MVSIFSPNGLKNQTVNIAKKLYSFSSGVFTGDNNRIKKAVLNPYILSFALGTLAINPAFGVALACGVYGSKIVVKKIVKKIKTGKNKIVNKEIKTNNENIKSKNNDKTKENINELNENKNIEVFKKTSINQNQAIKGHVAINKNNLSSTKKVKSR